MPLQPINLNPHVGPALAPEQPAEKPDLKMIELWKKYGWTNAPATINGKAVPLRDLTSILIQHSDCARFLRTSGLLYAIRGYQHTLDNSRGPINPDLGNMQEGIKFDDDGHPLLLVEGAWMRWENLKALVQYDPKEKKVVSIANSEQEWNYFSPNGLCPRGRSNDIYSIYQISEGDQAALQQLGEKFFRGDVPTDLQENRQNWHYIQLFSSHNDTISKLSHIGLRLINSAGMVYSLGFETFDDTPFSEQYLAGTYDAHITSLDYDEFKQFYSRRVTTIPLTENKYNDGMARIQQYVQIQQDTDSKRTLRFNRVHQNCSTYATDIMKAVGHPVDITSTLPEFVLDLAPAIPLVRKVKEAVIGFFTWILPSFITKVIGVVYRLLVTVAIKICSLCLNLLTFCCAGANKGSPIEDPEEENIELDKQEGLKYFDRLVKTPGDVFKNNPIYSPPKFVNWQLEQASTFIHKYDDSPQLVILPIEVV